MKEILRILAVVDGRAGHDKQTYGIIAALRRYQTVLVTRIAVDHSLRAKIRAAMQFLFPFMAPFEKKEREADLILCTGGKTHFPAMLRKRKYALPLCTCMAPGVGFRWMFDFCFIPEHDQVAAAPNVVATLGAPNLCVDAGLHDPAVGLIVLGGTDDRSHHWPEERLLAEITQLLADTAEKHWIISSSPRTPQSTVENVQALVAGFAGARFFDYAQTEKGWIEAQYARAAVAWITSDSISMIYEALSAGCRVGLLSMDWHDASNKFATNERLLLEYGVVGSFADWKREGIVPQADGFNEAQRCADAIMEKWWPDRLQ